MHQSFRDGFEKTSAIHKEVKQTFYHPTMSEASENTDSPDHPHKSTAHHRMFGRVLGKGLGGLLRVAHLPKEVALGVIVPARAGLLKSKRDKES
jgi:hypothetical protein